MRSKERATQSASILRVHVMAPGFRAKNVGIYSTSEHYVCKLTNVAAPLIAELFETSAPMGRRP